MATALQTPYDHLPVQARGAVGRDHGTVASVHSLRPRPAASPSPATYLRRRIIVGLGALLVVLGLALAVATPGTAATTAPAQPALVEIADTVTLLPGQTLWELAVDATPAGGDPRVVLDAIRDLNGITSNLVPAYTTIAIPATS